MDQTDPLVDPAIELLGPEVPAPLRIHDAGPVESRPVRGGRTMNRRARA